MISVFEYIVHIKNVISVIGEDITGNQYHNKNNVTFMRGHFAYFHPSKNLNFVSVDNIDSLG